MNLNHIEINKIYFKMHVRRYTMEMHSFYFLMSEFDRTQNGNVRRFACLSRFYLFLLYYFFSFNVQL